MLKKKEISEIRKELQSCTNPLFIFDDDPDGLCSFLQLYKFVGGGNGVIVKSSPNVDMKFLRKVEEYNPDKVFILDIANVEQEFVDSVKQPIIWIDHHEVKDLNGVKYYNPRKSGGESRPVAYLCHQVTEDYDWIAMIGFIGDWFLPDDFNETFAAKYPRFFPKKLENPGEALFDTPFSKLIRIYSFCLKGKHSDVKRNFKILTRIKEPHEILDKTTSQGKFIYKYYERINNLYKNIWKDVKKKITRSRFLIYEYTENEMSFTAELSNELLFRYPEKIIIIAREKNGEMKCSIRSGGQYNISKILAKVLPHIEGYGGGHEQACGACIAKDSFQNFVSLMKKEFKAIYG